MEETQRRDGEERPLAGPSTPAAASFAAEVTLPAPSREYTETPRTGWASRLIEWSARYPLALLGLACVLALVARVVLVARTHAMIDGDEALVGIQAERILHGQYPIYFYGQVYMGSLEAYLAAVVFRVFGPSNWALRAVPIALSLLLVYLTWRIARALLPRGARTTPLLAGIAALFAAVPPLYDAVTELRTWGGQIEVYVITLALLLATLELAERLRGDARAFALARRWLVLGFLAGLGIWINPLISYGLVACALWLLFPLVARTLPRLWARLARQSGGAQPPAIPAARGPELAATLALLPGLAVGGLPAWIYAAQHNAENLLVYVTQPSVSPAISGAARHGRLFLGAAITFRYVTCVGPHVLDGGLPAEALAYLPLRLALLVPPLAGIICAGWLVAQHFHSGSGMGTLRAGLPLLYAGVVTAVFCLGTSAWPATVSNGCVRDEAGRYAVPLVLVEPFLLLALFAAPRVWAAWRQHRGRQALAALSLSLQGKGARGLGSGWSLVLAVLLVAGAVQFGTYALANPAATFQSPFYRRVPLDDAQLLAYLKAHNIHDAWANHWLGNIVTFQTNGQTLCADYYDQVVKGGIERPPGSLQAVMQAQAPSFILLVQDAHPKLAQELDARHIPYTLAVLPQAGVTVITPARSVNPATVADALGVDYAY